MIAGEGETFHQTAAIASGSAQPAAVAEPLPRGRVWRGWLWIVLLVAKFAAMVFSSDH